MQVSGGVMVYNIHMQIRSTDKVDNLQLYTHFCGVLDFLIDLFWLAPLFSPIFYWFSNFIFPVSKIIVPQFSVFLRQGVLKQL